MTDRALTYAEKRGQSFAGRAQDPIADEMLLLLFCQVV